MNNNILTITFARVNLTKPPYLLIRAKTNSGRTNKDSCINLFQIPYLSHN